MSSAKMQGDLWSAAASDWAELQENGHIPLFTAMLDATQVGENTRLLDVGCGSGTSSELAAKRGAIITGIDAAEGLIEIARERVPAAEFRIGDMEDLPFEDDTFDVVFAANSLQYANDRVAALQEFKRVCRAGGFITIGLFGEPNDVDYKIVLKAVGDSLPEPSPSKGPFGLSDPAVLHKLFDAAELPVLLHDKVNCPFEFADTDTFWRAARSGGPVVGIIRQVGEDKVKQSVLQAISSMQDDDGKLSFANNYFQYLVVQVEG